MEAVIETVQGEVINEPDTIYIDFKYNEGSTFRLFLRNGSKVELIPGEKEHQFIGLKFGAF